MCVQCFLKAKDYILKCLVLSTSQRYSVYCHKKVLKPITRLSMQLYSVCVCAAVSGFVNTLNTSTEGNATMVSHENQGGGPLNPHWPVHFPRTLSVCVCVCVFDAMLETRSAMSLFPLGHMCSLVLSRLRAQQ